MANVDLLQPRACIGFSGSVAGGLQAKVDADGETFVCYPLGSMVVVSQASAGMCFMKGHSQAVSCVAVSPDGKWLASGQSNERSVEAPILVWDMDGACRTARAKSGICVEPVKRLMHHLGKIQAVAFSCDSQYLASIGGRDDNKLVVWQLVTGRALCSVCAASENTIAITWFNKTTTRLVTIGDYHVRVWYLDAEFPRIHPMDARMGRLRRNFTCVAITRDDKFAICGPTSGELVQIDVTRDTIRSFNDPDTKVPRLVGLSKERFGKGVLSVALFTVSGSQIVATGCGDGTVAFFNAQSLRPMPSWPSVSVEGGVTSISIVRQAKQRLAIGTDLCNRYELLAARACTAMLKSTAHVGSVHDVCFPQLSSNIVVTASIKDVRIWDTVSCVELLRIEVTGVNCVCVAVTAVGDSIVSGWSDGKIRAFSPESGKLLFAVPDAHSHQGVSALAICNEGAAITRSDQPYRLVTGGIDGYVRVWKVARSHRRLVHSMKEHRATITSVQVAHESDQFVSASKDGACIVWCLQRYVRLAALLESTLFHAAVYHPDVSQILTADSNHNIIYWESCSGEPIRVVHGGDTEMTTLDVSASGSFFVSGSADATLRLWYYDAGVHFAEGIAHPSGIEAVIISPDQQTVVSAGLQGAVLVWSIPKRAAFSTATV